MQSNPTNPIKVLIARAVLAISAGVFTWTGAICWQAGLLQSDRAAQTVGVCMIVVGVLIGLYAVAGK